MLSWFSIILIIVTVLLTMIVIRLSEISTRIQTLEHATERAVAETARMNDETAEFVTHNELQAILRHTSPYFTMGTTDR